MLNTLEVLVSMLMSMMSQSFFNKVVFLNKENQFLYTKIKVSSQSFFNKVVFLNKAKRLGKLENRKVVSILL